MEGGAQAPGPSARSVAGIDKHEGTLLFEPSCTIPQGVSDTCTCTSRESTHAVHGGGSRRLGREMAGE